MSGLQVIEYCGVVSIRPVLVLVTAILASLATVGRGEESAVDFRRDIRPILAEKCFSCHGPDSHTREAGLRLDTRDGLLTSLTSEDLPAVKPHNRQGSHLWLRITDEDPDFRMPPVDFQKVLDEEEIETLGRWIDEGAVFQEHWAYASPWKHPLPEVSNRSWARNSLDHFVLARLESLGLVPGVEADSRTLVRRLWFDLTGLPPTSGELERAVQRLDTPANHPASYEQIVDDLLQSPRYGERMAVYWLDLVRYADSVGYHGDQEISVSPYRDYVIRAFNHNMPFDQFTREQLGGDLLPQPKRLQMIAAGYNRLGMMSAEGGVQPKEYLAKYAAERVRNLSIVWLASTLGCAECHDHKFDPFTQHDFYSLAAFFADIQEKGLYGGDDKSGGFGPKMALPTPEQSVAMEKLNDEVRLLRNRMAMDDDQTDEEKQKLLEEIEGLEQEKAKLQSTFVTASIVVQVEPRTMRVLPRGNWMDESGPIVQPAVPHFLTSIEKSGRASRLDLASWIMAPENPLTARAFVNRIWKLLFGRGLVVSLDDFGAQGSTPTHARLLDHLAISFRDGGWDVKQLVRTIVMSATYRQSSSASAEIVQRDPYNELLARQGRFRLDAEMIRDNALAVSGLLVEKLGGRSVKPYQPAGYYEHLNFPKREYQQDEGDSLWRRSVYTHWQRQFLHPSLLMFDAPSREECAVERPRSNTPLAALVLLNDPIYVEAARGLAARMIQEGGNSLADRARFAVKETLGRPPSTSEMAVLTSVYEGYRDEMQVDNQKAQRLNQVGQRTVPTGVDATELAVLTGVARVILNLHETITRY
jgi:hypothetical protein